MTPITFYFLITFLISSSLTFLIFAIIGRLDVLSAIFSVVILNLLAFYLFGRYLCILELTDNKIALNCIYPIRRIKEYTFNKISEIDNRGGSAENSSGVPIPEIAYTFNRGFYRLYLTDLDGKLLDIKYNISDADNTELITILKKQLIQS